MTLDPLTSVLAAVVVLLVGTLVNRRVAVLSRYNIPDPITGGLIFAVLAAALLWIASFRVGIDQTMKPVLLLMFFAGVGMSADLRMLRHGGRALIIFLAVLFPYILLQNGVGLAVARMLDLHPIYGLVGGSIALVGGHGTGAAYADRFAEVNNLQAVMELTMTVATVGLILGGILGGPVAQYLISRFDLRGQDKGIAAPVQSARGETPIDAVGTVGALAGILAAVVAGRWLESVLSGGPVTIPGFLWCLIVGIAIRNTAPLLGAHFDDRASELIAAVSLSLFLVLTMMSLDLLEAALSVGPFLVILGVQVVGLILYAVFVCFSFMGKDYESAVTSGAFVGFGVGTTATAVANMQAIIGKYGPAPRSNLIVPLSGAFFIDIINAFLLTLILALPFVGG